MNSDSCPGPITSTRRPGCSTRSARSRRNGVHGSPALQPRSDNRSWTRVPSGASTDALPTGNTPQCGSDMSATTRRASSSLARRDSHPEDLGTVKESDGEKLPVSAPGPKRCRHGLRAEAPIPAKVARMQLHRRGLSLPVSKHTNDIAQPVDVRGAQRDTHTCDQTPSPMPGALQLRAQDLWAGRSRARSGRMRALPGRRQPPENQRRHGGQPLMGNGGSGHPRATRPRSLSAV